MKELYIKINSNSIGDTLAATPSIRKVYNCYNQKINIVTHIKELFNNNAYVKNIYSFDEFNKVKIATEDEIFETFCGIGIKDRNGIEKKHATIDIRRFHAMDLGFDLLPEEMHYDFIPNNDRYTSIDKKYICLHVSKTWDSRTYSTENWQKVIEILEKNNYYIVLIGKNSSETGFFNINKPVQNLKLTNGIDLTNKLNLSQLWHILNEAVCVVTMDSGILHFAGTTDTHIIQLGSSINNKLRSPYRRGTQDYKYTYVSGPCDIFCASNMKYGIKEWGSINGVPPLIKCLENKPTFECHPDPVVVCDKILSLFGFVSLTNKKYLFIAGHLSTGGAPNYLLWLINKVKKEGNEVKVIEWNLYSDVYVIHRNKIIDLVGKENFLSVGAYHESDAVFYPKEISAKQFILNYNPDYIHINDFVEQIAIKPMSTNFLLFLYDKYRKYKIAETAHDSNLNINQKTFLPDEYWFCTPYHMNQYTRKDIPAFLYEMQIPDKERPNRDKTLKLLGLDPNYVHVLQVGLFTENKNQHYTFNLAKNFLKDKIQFHFVGNQCYINSCNVDVNQANCKVWGERSDIDTFMSCMDLFILPSKAELNPISLKEAIAWKMPCLVSKLKTLSHINHNLVKFIEDTDTISYIKNMIASNTSVNYNKIIDSNIIKYSFFPSPKVEITGDQKFKYEIKFIDKKTNQIHHSGLISNNMWISCDIEYYCDWQININNVYLNEEQIIDFDLTDKNIRIINESPSLGDYIAWMPYVQKFKETYNCYIDFFTPNKDIFESEYPDINFYNYNHNIIKDFKQYYASYKIGCFNPKSKHLCPEDYRNTGLQNLAALILGLKQEEILPNVSVKNTDRKISKKYVCISTASTSGCKHWQNKEGWQKTVDYLKELEYEVVVLQKEPLNYMDLNGLTGVHHPKTESLHDVINYLYNCEFFIGLSSGISWLAWALRKKVVLISGFTSESYEFSNPYRIINKSVCNGCWNDVNFLFNPGDWNWCPRNKNTDKQFECTKQIKFEDVRIVIDNLISDFESKNEMIKYDSTTYKEIFETNQYQKFVNVNKNDFILDLGCSKGYFYFKNKNLNISYIGVDGSIDCIQDFITNLNNDTRPKLINAVLTENKSVISFPSMFHNNIINKSLSISFEDLLFLINRKIDFFKFDIEGYEKFFLYDNLDLFKKNVKKFSGEFHLTSDIFDRDFGLQILTNLKNDKDIVYKIYSVDGYDITDLFWTITHYYTEIIISGYVKDNFN